MSLRQDVVEMLDDLTEQDLRAVEQYARYLRGGAAGDFLTWVLDNAPIDDEPTTPEEERLVAEAREQIRRCETVTAEQLKRELGL